MRLGVNGWRMHGMRTGVWRYVFNVVRHWGPLASKVFSEITLYSAKPIDTSEMPIPENIHLKVLDSNWPMLLWENFRLAPNISDDVLFGPSYSIPFYRNKKTVVSTFDAVSKLYPDFFPKSVRFFYNPLYGWSARHANLVIAGSEASRQDVARCWNVPLSKIRVVRLAPSEIFHPETDFNKVETARRQYVGEVPFFLFVGKLSGRRSLPPLLEAFSEFKKRTKHPHQLVLVGLNPHNLDLARMTIQTGIQQYLKYCGYVSDQDLNLLYNAAQAFVMPSVYETLSLPVMEAQATGTPVICIDTAGMREITGGKAVMVARLEAPLLLEAMIQLAEDGAMRKSLSREGLLHSQNFSWGRTASETMAVLEEAAQM